MPLGLLCIAAVAIDGDSIRCRNLGEIRLLAIDAPDRTSSRPCRERFGDHRCDDAGAKAAKASLRAGLKLGPVMVEEVTRDRYGRLVARASAGETNLSCWQLKRRQARYIARYDNGGRVRKICR
jgi:micrococcal nuclease